MLIQAKDFAKRSDLESYVRKHFDLTPKAKEAKIQGTKEELAKLRLSDKAIFWGISCERVDQEESEEAAPVDRGEKKPFGINGQTTKAE